MLDGASKDLSALRKAFRNASAISGSESIVPGAFLGAIGEQVRRIGVERQRLRGLDVVGRQSDVAKLAGIHARQLVQGLAGAVDADRPEQGLAQGLANGLQERRKVRGPAVPDPFKSV